MTSWINLQIHDWFFHEFSDTESYKVQWGPRADNTFLLRKTVKDADGYAANTETPWYAEYCKSWKALSRLADSNPHQSCSHHGLRKC